MTETIGSNLPNSAQAPLSGLGGWLAFALVVLTLSGIMHIVQGVPLLYAPASGEDMFVGIVSTVIAAWAFLTVWSIWQEKKFARGMAISLFTAIFILSVVGAFFSAPDNSNEGPLLIWSMISNIVKSGAWIVYFIRSERVKNTLVN